MLNPLNSEGRGRDELNGMSLPNPSIHELSRKTSMFPGRKYVDGWELLQTIGEGSV
jgi:hypothetical protein